MSNHDDTANSFWYWVRNYEPKVTVAIAIVAFVINIAHILRFVLDGVNQIWFPAVWFGLQVVVVFILFFYTYRQKPLLSEKPQHQKASAATKNFHFLFLILWITWTLLYGALTIRSLTSLDVKSARIEAACRV